MFTKGLDRARLHCLARKKSLATWQRMPAWDCFWRVRIADQLAALGSQALKRIMPCRRCSCPWLHVAQLTSGPKADRH